MPQGRGRVGPQGTGLRLRNLCLHLPKRSAKPWAGAQSRGPSVPPFMLTKPLKLKRQKWELWSGVCWRGGLEEGCAFSSFLFFFFFPLEVSTHTYTLRSSFFWSPDILGPRNTLFLWQIFLKGPLERHSYRSVRETALSAVCPQQTALGSQQQGQRWRGQGRGELQAQVQRAPGETQGPCCKGCSRQAGPQAACPGPGQTQESNGHQCKQG